MLGLFISTIIRAVASIGTVKFKVSPRIQMLKGLLEKPLYVSDTPLQLTAVDVVELGLV